MEIGLSLGVNLGDRLLQLQKAERQIAAIQGVALVARSPVYETEPVGVPGTERDLFFLNAVLVVETLLSVPELFLKLKQVERQLGRLPRMRQNAPRPIDIDIIYADNMRLRQDDITVPHPRWSSRKFVVQPLSDVRPDLIVPGQTGTVAEVLSQLVDEHLVKLFTKEW